jgi:hypothetical protein
VAPPAKIVRSAPPGARRYRNLSIEVHGEARLVDPTQAQPQQGNDHASSPP